MIAGYTPLAGDRTVVVKQLVVTERGYKRETDGDITSDLVQLFPSLFAFLGKPFERRESDRQKLNND